MGFLSSVIFITICVSLLSGQHFVEARIDGIPQWKGMLEPMFSDWNGLDSEKYGWNSKDSYLAENTIDGSDYSGLEYNNDAIRHFIMNTRPQPSPAITLSDLFRYNQLSDILDGSARIPDNSDLTKPFNILKPAVNDISVPSPTGNGANLIPSSMIASRPFRLATLASIGYGQNFRFYR